MVRVGGGYLAEGVAALGDVGLGQPTHADGAVVLLQELVDGDLDLGFLNHIYISGLNA